VSALCMPSETLDEDEHHCPAGAVDAHAAPRCDSHDCREMATGQCGEANGAVAPLGRGGSMGGGDDSTTGRDNTSDCELSHRIGSGCVDVRQPRQLARQLSAGSSRSVQCQVDVRCQVSSAETHHLSFQLPDQLHELPDVEAALLGDAGKDVNAMGLRVEGAAAAVKGGRGSLPSLPKTDAQLGCPAGCGSAAGASHQYPETACVAADPALPSTPSHLSLALGPRLPSGTGCLLPPSGAQRQPFGAPAKRAALPPSARDAQHLARPLAASRPASSRAAGRSHVGALLKARAAEAERDAKSHEQAGTSSVKNASLAEARKNTVRV